MKLNPKRCIGIALTLSIIFAFYIQRKAENERMEGIWRKNYQQIRIQISWHLIALRHQHGTQQKNIARHTISEIKELWYDRDVLFQALYHRPSQFSADSLALLETLINQDNMPHTIVREIDRVDHINEVD